MMLRIVFWELEISNVMMFASSSVSICYVFVSSLGRAIHLNVCVKNPCILWETLWGQKIPRKYGIGVGVLNYPVTWYDLKFSEDKCRLCY
jgi:hypothetical protein